MRFGARLADVTGSSVWLHAQPLDGYGDATAQAAAKSAAIHASQGGTYRIELGLIAYRLGKSQRCIEIVDAGIDLATLIRVGLT